MTDGIAIHWHGVDVPNAEDGVAGITQDAIKPGEDYTYRWVAPHAGTFWYHSHQVSHEQVAGGLLGGILIHPRHSDAGRARTSVAVAHLYDGKETVNGTAGFQPVEATPGQRVRVRVVNTDNGPQGLWASVAVPAGRHRRVRRQRARPRWTASRSWCPRVAGSTSR